MLFLYNISIKIYFFLIFISKAFSKKAKLWFEGREKIFEKINSEVDCNHKCIWFHFASLGEFEQGRPVLEKLKRLYPGKKIVVTFFSPSGYELRKNYSGADHIFYLPLDTSSNAKKFIESINPEIAIFTKYEFWYHYFQKLYNKQIHLYIISGIFRPSQPFFKWYGSFNRKILSFVTYFFVQDEGSKKLLNSIHLNNVQVSGDTRFDRVAENAANPKQFPIVKDFCGDSRTFVAGSTWPDDEKLIAALVHEYIDWRFIIAPHEIKEEKIKSLIDMLPKEKAIRFSELKQEHSDNNSLPQVLSNKKASVLIIDNIGMLSSLYQYGKVAYIGGGFGVGIHNTLEAAAFGIPVIFGPNFKKFLEAKALLAKGGGFSISGEDDLLATMNKLQQESFRIEAGKIAGQYVQESKGATDSFINFIQKEKAL